MFKRILAGLIVAVVMAVAAPGENAVAAYARSDYGAALKLWTPLAEEGNGNAQINLRSLYANNGVPQAYAEAMRYDRDIIAANITPGADELHFNYEASNGPFVRKAAGTVKDIRGLWDALAALQPPPGAHGGYGLIGDDNLLRKEPGYGLRQLGLVARRYVTFDTLYVEQPSGWEQNGVQSGTFTNLGQLNDTTLGWVLFDLRSKFEADLKARLPIVGVAISSPAKAGAYEDALAAFDKGDYATALSLLRPLADQGDPKAQTELGAMYANGQGVPKDYAQAMNWLQLAAKQGFAQAQDNLAWIYFNGAGVPRNYPEAMKWYRLAAAQGLAAAEDNLADMYKKGEGVKEDDAKAAKWYQLAADQGYAAGQYDLGFEYWGGLPPDYVQAYMWFSLAAAGGIDNGNGMMSDCSNHMTPEQIAEAQRLAAEWKPKTQP
jgi:TPR repeat protein